MISLEQVMILSRRPSTQCIIRSNSQIAEAGFKDITGGRAFGC